MATIYDVAERAGVSAATVSAVVNNSAYVSPELRERVEGAIAQLQYHPNLLARSLAQNRTHTIGMLIPDITNPFYPETVRGAEDKAKEAGYTLILGNSDNRAEAEETYLKLLLSKRVDGVLLWKAPGDMSSLFIERLRHNKCPVVLMGRTYSPLQADTVVTDDVEGGYTAVRHLIRMGHRRIGIVMGIPSVSTTEGRLQGYRKALEANRIPYDPSLVVRGDYGQKSGYRGGLRLLEQKPTAVFVTSDLMTVGFMEALEDKKLRCPEDVAVVSYDDVAWARFFHPPLTSVEQPKYLLGYRAMEILLDRLHGKHKRSKLVVLKNKLRIRESCGHLLHAGRRT